MITDDVIQSLENVDEGNEVGLDYKVMGHSVRDLLGYMSRRLNAQGYHFEVITRERDEAITKLDIKTNVVDGLRNSLNWKNDQMTKLNIQLDDARDRVDYLKAALSVVEEARDRAEEAVEELNELNEELREENDLLTKQRKELADKCAVKEGYLVAVRRNANAAIEAKAAAEQNEADMSEENGTMARDLTHLREENGKLRMTLQERTKRIEAMQVRVRDGQDAQTFMEGYNRPGGEL